MANRTLMPLEPSLVIERKVKGGKLFRLRISNIESSRFIQLTGDFFLEPEEGIDAIEACLTECLEVPDKREAERRLTRTIAESQIQIVGFEARDIIDALWEARS